MPLSEYEQRVLSQLEAQLASEDPDLGSRLASSANPRRGRLVLGIAGVLVGLVLLVLGLIISVVGVSLFGFLAMFAGALFCFSSPGRRGGPAPVRKVGSSGQPSNKPGLSERFEKRFHDPSGSL
jgi:hypothetical protein